MARRLHAGSASICRRRASGCKGGGGADRCGRLADEPASACARPACSSGARCRAVGRGCRRWRSGDRAPRRTGEPAHSAHAFYLPECRPLIVLVSRVSCDASVLNIIINL
jgi:hypothetical protein